MIVVIAATHLSLENQVMSARTMNRIELVYQVARFGFVLALGVLALSALFATELRSKPTTVRIQMLSRPTQLR